MNFLRAISNLLRFDRTNWKALALCLFAAAIFWIFNALNKNYATNVSFPLRFEYDNIIYVPSQPLPARLTLNVGGNGWELLRKSIGMKVPTITLPLERPAEVRKIPGSALSPIVASQMGALQLNFIVTDTVRIHLELKVSRKLKLVADLKEVTFKKSFARTSPVVVLPDSVLMEGPRSFIDKLGDTLRLKVQASRISNNFRERIELVVDNNEFIIRNPPVAEVIFEVSAVEDVMVLVKLKIPKIPLSVEVDHDSARCVLSIPAKEHDRFLRDASSMVATFNVVDLRKGETTSLLPIVTGVPEYATLVKADSIKLKKN